MTTRPMLAVPGNPSRNRRGQDLTHLEGTHAFDTKIDGVRGILRFDGKRVSITNRNGVDITGRFPELSVKLPCPMELDGEVVARDNSFESTAIRDKNARPTDAMIEAIPVTYVAFDVLNLDGNDRSHLAWSTRRQMLDVLEASLASVGMTVSTYSLKASFYDTVVSLGLEGVIAKRLDQPYAPGKRSSGWVKFKATQRVTAIAVGYEPGTGARSHFGAMNLVMLDANRQPVNVGKVGTGFTERQMLDLKQSLDAGQPLLVEIECLNVTKTGVLRFPVFRGQRTDLGLLDATTKQLDSLPRC